MMERKNELLIRAYLVMVLFALMAFVIFYRVVKISLVEGNKWRELGGKNVKMVPLKADRGDIYSDDGTVLVTSLPFFDIRMDLMRASDKLFYDGLDSLSYLLSQGVGNHKTASEWRGEMKKYREAKLPGRSYFKIANNISYDQLIKIKKYPIFRNGKLGGGLIIEKNTVREKPFKSLALRTLGEVRDNASNYGLESYFNEYLEGDTDSLLMKRVRGGAWIPVYDMNDYISKEGDDLYTTLDVDIQDIVQSELLNSMIENEARGGAAIVMEVKTGEIKAISNFEWSDKQQTYLESYNHSIGTLSEPGSTFKTATALALLDDGFVGLNSKVDLKGGKKKFYSEWMYDSSPHGIRESNLKEIFAISSNVGIAEFAMQYYEKRDSGRINFVSKLKQFRLDRGVGIELEGERKPFIKNPEDSKDGWSGTTVPWMAHGYELKLTPLQILAFYNAIANDGRYMKPFLVKEIQREGKVIQKNRPKGTKRRIAGAKAIKGIQTMLEEVVKTGTAKRLKSDIVGFAGKTGTARSGYDQEEEKKMYNASFAGYFPAKNPKYSVMVLVYEPKINYHGAKAAGPVFKSIAEKVYALKYDQFASSETSNKKKALPGKHLGYAADFKKLFEHTGINYKKASKKWAVIDPSDEKMNIAKLKINKNQVPDVEGMGLRDAIYVLENLGLKVYAEGVGKVRDQSLSPGTKINGQAINLYLN